MKRQRSAKDLTVDELRQLIIEKRRAERQSRLDHFRRTGRVVHLETDPSPASLDNLRSIALSDEDDNPAAPSRSVRRVWFDRLLVLVEVAAVFGLVFILLNGINVLRDLNSEVASALVMPTLTPTPIIKAVVLPSGHTPPDSPGGVQPNDAEIPEHLRPLVQSLANLPVPTVGPQQAARIQIPAIGVDAPVVQGDGWEQLKKGVGQHIGTPNPGENGNIVLSAHNDVFGEIFRDLDQLKDGDKVILFTNQRTFTYIVRQSQIVEPTHVEVMAPTKEPVVTLISCYPYRVDNKRIVISAHLESES
jgi:sortase A